MRSYLCFTLGRIPPLLHMQTVSILEVFLYTAVSHEVAVLVATPDTCHRASCISYTITQPYHRIAVPVLCQPRISLVHPAGVYRSLVNYATCHKRMLNQHTVN